ncbi:hypothetical protein NQD34_012892 [Periophthalmus magnuspinnatus]|uniref:uncharacterized protein LOC129456986 n=1 Tax=Periophthalmus magnuspinnatus TaxID=409849 RepID=UPI0022C3B6E5|nr:uncharacterized protein LOC129456986 [Periophthalmus magnuspinnatus]KAJ0011917.1 hypothetical protein NQD34_012892 [Periophthalmus magnuspinnatus]
MGSLQCLSQEVSLLASIARDICPFPNYQITPHVQDFLSLNSSTYLNNRYATVQSSLSVKQLEDFTQSLRSTFGREGRVSYGGVGVVALSLAILFDTVAQQVKGEYVSDQEPIPGLFLKNFRGYYSPSVYTISKYLRLVPHIANNPTRMRQETERYLKQLTFDYQLFEKQWMKAKQDDVTVVNQKIGEYLHWHLYIHLQRLTNATFADKAIESAFTFFNNTTNDKPPTNISYHNVNLNLNCNPEESSKEFLDEIKKSDERTQNAFKRCKPEDLADSETLQHIAKTDWLAVNEFIFNGVRRKEQHIAQKEDFDLKVGALRKWETH